MASRLVALCVAAHDPRALAGFWADALGWEVGAEDEAGVALAPTDGTRFTLRFTPGAGPKTGKNPIHLDLTTASLADQQGSAERFVARGARAVDIGQTADEGHVVLADPEGNELCLIGPGSDFLAGCGRLGSITCDGSREVGVFWSAVLAWPLVWDQDGETAVRAPDGTGPLITWGPPVPPRPGPHRLQLELAPEDDGDRRAEVDRLVALGATRLDGGDGDDGDRVTLLDPDGNRFRIVDPAG